MLTYKQNEDVKARFDGWYDRDDALEHLRQDYKQARKRAPK